jgi:hypothetical protein
VGLDVSGHVHVLRPRVQTHENWRLPSLVRQCRGPELLSAAGAAAGVAAAITVQVLDLPSPAAQPGDMPIHSSRRPSRGLVTNPARSPLEELRLWRAEPPTEQ